MSLCFLLRDCISESLLETFKTEEETISEFNPVHDKETRLPIKLLITITERRGVYKTQMISFEGPPCTKVEMKLTLKIS
jgi:hypothetical protein